MKTLWLILTLLLVGVPAHSQSLSVVKKQGDLIIFSWDPYGDQGQAGFHLKVNTQGDAFPYSNVPALVIGPTATTATYTAQFPSNANVLYFRIHAFEVFPDGTMQDGDPSNSVTVQRGIGPPGNVKVK